MTSTEELNEGINRVECENMVNGAPLDTDIVDLIKLVRGLLNQRNSYIAQKHSRARFITIQMVEEWEQDAKLLEIVNGPGLIDETQRL